MVYDDTLFSEYLDDRISHERFELLQAWLREDPQARRGLLTRAALDAHLRERRELGASANGESANYIFARPWVRIVCGIAAALVLAAGLWIATVLTFDTQMRVVVGGGVATVTDANSAVVAQGHDAITTGAALGPGRIELAAGRVELTFGSGAVVDLTGPCVFDLTDQSSGALVVGAVEAFVPAEARGFTLHGPRGFRVVDLGTRFRLAVGADGAARVDVIDGVVECSAPGLGSDVIGAGEAVTLDAAGSTLTRHAAVRQPIVADFAGGEGDADADQFPGRPGDGWTTGWLMGTNRGGADVTWSTRLNAPDGEGRRGLRIEMGHDRLDNVTRSIWRGYDEALLDQPHTIEWTAQIHELDRSAVSFHDGASPDAGLSDASSAYMIRVEPDDANGLRPWRWMAADAARDDGGYRPEQFVDTGMAAQPGRVYRFRVRVRPADRAYDLSISAEGRTVRLTDLAFRRSAASVGGFAGFGAAVTKGRAVFTITDIKISATRPPLEPSGDTPATTSHQE